MYGPGASLVIEQDFIQNSISERAHSFCIIRLASAIFATSVCARSMFINLAVRRVALSLMVTEQVVIVDLAQKKNIIAVIARGLKPAKF